MVLAGAVGGRQVVAAASEEARAVGVVPGQTPRQAEHCCPGAVVLTEDPLAYEATFRALLAALGIAALPASVCFGMLYNWFGPLAAFGSGAGLALLAAVMLLGVRRRSP